MSEFGPPSEGSEREIVDHSAEREKTPEHGKRKPFDAVIVLGAGITDPLWKKFQDSPEVINPDGTITRHSEGSMLGLDAKMRTVAAAEMYIQGLTQKIIFTGGKTAEQRGINKSESELMKKYAAKLLRRADISEEEINKSIILEEKATNTIENIANVCNMIDQNPEMYKNIAILTNEYHLDRAKELISKFDLEAVGFEAEDLLEKRSEKYKKLIDNFFVSPGYQHRLAGERRWMKGLIDPKYGKYWAPQAITVENSQRVRYIIESLGLEEASEEFGQEGVKKVIEEAHRLIPEK